MSEEYQKYLESKGLPKDLPIDGMIHRFGDNQNGWATARELSTGTTIVAHGDWATGSREHWTSNLEPGAKMSVAEHVELEAMRKQAKEEKAKLQEEVASNAGTKEWPAWDNNRLSEYQKSKRINGFYGAAYHCGNLEIPLRDISNKLWGHQTISPNGRKQFTKGMKTKGSFFDFEPTTPSPLCRSAEIFYICEGWSTGATIFETLGPGTNVISAMNANNLSVVAKDFRKKYSKSIIYICADNDAWTNVKGRPKNVGVVEAVKAASACDGEVKVPLFASPVTGHSDFNDLMRVEGVDMVKAQLTGEVDPRTLDLMAHESVSAWIPKVVSEEPGLPYQIGGIATTPNITPNTPKSKGPSESQVYDMLMDFFSYNLLGCGKDIFLYNRINWELLSPDQEKLIKRKIGEFLGPSGGIRQIERCFGYTQVHLPTPPSSTNMYATDPWRANFLNGTLHAVPDGENNQRYNLEFRDHCREDYLTSHIPLNYDPVGTKRNTKFEEMINRVFGDDPDRLSKIQATKELYGSCVMGLYPRLFVLVGRASTGKSSVIIPAQHLIHKDNYCSVEPSDMKNFGLEPMMGKMVNIVTDIDTRKQLSDSKLKRVEDRANVSINRKGKPIVMAPLPPVHIFATNELPPTSDGGSGAYRRRWTIIEFDNVVGQGPGGNHKNYANHVFKECPEGVLNFAMEGLRSIIKNQGKYTVPASGEEMMDEWLTDNNVASEFVRDIQNGEIPSITPKEGDRLERKQLYESFKEWNEESNAAPRSMGRSTFYKKLAEHGAVNKRTVQENGVHHFVWKLPNVKEVKFASDLNRSPY